MKPERNTVISKGDSVLRVLAVTEDEALVIDCKAVNMPRWKSVSEISDWNVVPEEVLYKVVGAQKLSESELTQPELAKARIRYSMIAPVLTVLSDDEIKSAVINRICEERQISRRTLTGYLCRYLVFQDITALSGHRKTPETKPLTRDQKNMRWALYKFYYNRRNNPLTVAYVQLLKAKYTDETGKLFENYPSFNQFRYFFRKTRKRQSEIISRKGKKEYELNYRPLLGDGVQEMAVSVGFGMLDATVCDIYLIDDSGNLVGRPVLQVCVDAYSSLCCGYALLWEGGVYGIRELMLNVVSDKTKWCRTFGITIEPDQWPSCQLPGNLITDRGSEFISYNFEQITELGCNLISLPSFSANLKGPVEKLFDLVQESFKPYLKGKGVIEPDFQKRGATDYRKEACLTIDQFEKIIISCILFHNSRRVLENFQYSQEMLEANVKPFACDIWNYCKDKPGSNLISVSKKELILTLLPRTTGKFSRKGLRVNGMRYRCNGYIEQYLSGGEAVVAYNPDDVSEVYLVSDGFRKFELIERRFQGKELSAVESLKSEQCKYVKTFEHDQLQAKIDLANQIELIAGQSVNPDDVQLKKIRKTRKKERSLRHRDLLQEVMLSE